MSQEEKWVLQRMLKYTAIGSPDTVRKELEAMIEETQADELIVTNQIFDHQARLRSYELLAEAMGLKN